MIFVAGPPGGGKSSALSIKQLGIEWFNADDRVGARPSFLFRSGRRRAGRRYEAGSVQPKLWDREYHGFHL